MGEHDRIIGRKSLLLLLALRLYDNFLANVFEIFTKATVIKGG